MKIFIADDHGLFRAGLRSVLTTLWTDLIVQEAENAEILRQQLPHHPDTNLLLLDLNLPDANGLELLIELGQIYPTLPMAILSAEETTGIVQNCLNRGALGFIPKSSSNELICSAIQLMLNGGRYIPEQFFAAPEIKQPPPSNQIKLTQRQQQILQLMAEGLSNKQIALQLHLALGTIKAHASAIFIALQANNRTQAVNKAREAGLLH